MDGCAYDSDTNARDDVYTGSSPRPLLYSYNTSLTPHPPTESHLIMLYNKSKRSGRAS